MGHMFGVCHVVSCHVMLRRAWDVSRRQQPLPQRDGVSTSDEGYHLQGAD